MKRARFFLFLLVFTLIYVPLHCQMLAGWFLK